MPTATAIHIENQTRRDDPVYRKIVEPVVHWSTEAPEGGIGLGTVFVKFTGDDKQPRHRHVFEQIRYIMSGSMTYGHKRVAQAGDCVYFPETVPYGPVGYEPGEFFLMQWAGPSEHGLWYSVETLDAAGAEMKESLGEFDLSSGGLFRYKDGRVQDGYEAVAEYLSGGPLSYPPARYNDQVLMRTSSFPAVPIAPASGVSIKHLGYFNEVGPNVKELEFDAGGTLPAAPPARSQQVWAVVDGEVGYEGGTYPKRSLLHVEPGASRAELSSTGGAKVLVVALGTPASAAIPFTEF